MKKFDMQLIAVQCNAQQGEAQHFTFKLTNCSEQQQTATICFQPPLHADPFQYFEVHLHALAPGESKEIPLQYTFNAGGRYVFYFWEKGAQLATLSKAQCVIEGAGYYSGDTHNHSFYSDGTSTLQENRLSMQQKGHSFLYSTDHNTLEHGGEIADFAQTEEAAHFLHMTGWEYTTRNGHALAYNTNDVYDPMAMTEMGNLQQWQQFVDDMVARDGFVFLAHPYEAPRYEFTDELLLNIENITGIEVWNGFNHHALAYENRKAFEMWDTLNKKGTQRYIGNAVSDAHTAEKQGNPFIKGFLQELTQAEVHRLLQTGQFIGSNGPEIEFTIDTASIGQVLHIAEREQLAKVRLSIFDPAGKIECITVYKCVYDRKMSSTQKRNKTVKALEIYPTGDAEKRLFEKEYYMNVEEGSFYRVEVITEFGIVAYSNEKVVQDKGFAYTNPIWIECKKS